MQLKLSQLSPAGPSPPAKKKHAAGSSTTEGDFDTTPASQTTGAATETAATPAAPVAAAGLTPPLATATSQACILIASVQDMRVPACKEIRH